MEGFLHSISAAAASPYAFAAYTVAAILFLFAGAKLRTTQALLTKVHLVPAAERRRALEIATGTVLPTHISPEQWIRNNRQKGILLLLASLLVVVFAVVVIGILNPTKADMEKMTKQVADETRAAVAKNSKDTASIVGGAERKIIDAVQDAALANLETMFPLAVRVVQETDGTVMTLNGAPRQRLISYDHNMAPMELYWGDQLHYSVYSEGGAKPPADASVLLEVVGSAKSVVIPLRIDPFGEQTVRIPGSSPKPMAGYLLNESHLTGIRFKIMISSADRERGRKGFRAALMNTSLGSAARRTYLEVGEDGVRLRSAPSGNAPILREVREGTYLKVKQRLDGWCNVRLPEAREGWINCGFLKPIA